MRQSVAHLRGGHSTVGRRCKLTSRRRRQALCIHVQLEETEARRLDVRLRARANVVRVDNESPLDELIGLLQHYWRRNLVLFPPIVAEASIDAAIVHAANAIFGRCPIARGWQDALCVLELTSVGEDILPQERAHLVSTVHLDHGHVPALDEDHLEAAVCDHMRVGFIQTDWDESAPQLVASKCHGAGRDGHVLEDEGHVRADVSLVLGRCS